jgi:hypothetical protein
VRVIAPTGRTGTPLTELADIATSSRRPAAMPDRVQELHIKVIHILIELVERRLAPGNYGASADLLVPLNSAPARSPSVTRENDAAA